MNTGDIFTLAFEAVVAAGCLYMLWLARGFWTRVAWACIVVGYLVGSHLPAKTTFFKTTPQNIPTIETPDEG